MAYNSNKGTQNFGDIHFEGDPAETQIDFEDDLIALKTKNVQRLIVSSSAAITASIALSCSMGITGSSFVGDGGGLTGIPASGVGAAGSNTQVQYNNGNAFAGSSNMVFDGTTLTVAGLSSTGNSILGDASGDSLTINAETIDIPNVAAGTDNTVVVYNGSTLVTDEIDSRVWGSTLVDATGTPSVNQVATWSDANTAQGSANLTFNGTELIVSGVLAVDSAGGIGSRVYFNVPEEANAFRVRKSGGTNAIRLDNDSGRLFFNNDTRIGSDTIAPDHALSVTGDISASVNISASAFYGDGSNLNGISAGPITNYNSAGATRIITSVNTSTVQGESNLTFDGTKLGIVGNVSASSNLSASTVTIGGANLASSALYVRAATDNSVVAIFKSPSNETIMAMTGSGRVVVGGSGAPYLEGKFNITGTVDDKLISLKSDTGEAFYVSGSGDTFVSGNLQMHTMYPMIEFTSSHASNTNAQIGINNAGNILLQNNTQNQHIVLKANDQGTIKEGFRLDGAVPEVVVNQTSDSLVNFRVESDNNTHMLYVDGSEDKIGINTDTPSVALDINSDAIRIRSSNTPSSATDFGTQGEIRWDANYIYICIATDTWRRVAHSTW